MPVIEVPIEEDRRLETIVPDYLKGDRKTRQRVRWAIEQLYERFVIQTEVLKRSGSEGAAEPQPSPTKEPSD